MSFGGPGGLQSLLASLGGAGMGAPATPAPTKVTFRAGKCQLVQQPNGKYQVTADVRRGSVTLEKTPDGMINFWWTNTVTSQKEDERFIMGPNECTFKKVKTGREGDRVYMLKFTGLGAQTMMYWMQHIDPARDEENVKKFTELLSTVGSATG